MYKDNEQIFDYDTNTSLINNVKLVVPISYK